VKKLFILCFLYVGCTYAPHYSLVKDSYNTYAPVYAPTQTETYAPVNTRNTYPTRTQQTYAFPIYAQRNVIPVRRYRAVIVKRRMP
jgi:hypothetical protein